MAIGLSPNRSRHTERGAQIEVRVFTQNGVVIDLPPTVANNLIQQGQAELPDGTEYEKRQKQKAVDREKKAADEAKAQRKALKGAPENK